MQLYINDMRLSNNNKKKRLFTKNRFLLLFVFMTLVLALIRILFPSLAKKGLLSCSDDTTPVSGTNSDTCYVAPFRPLSHCFYEGNGREVKHRILSVPGFDETFPDSNAVQLESANKNGVKVVADRHDAEKRMNELVYIGSNPFYFVKKLDSSIPYLVPRAAVLLQDIGRNFFDSLQVKKIPLHKIMVNSVLRTQEDVRKLQMHNRNATTKSCHLYGTTFDISYTRFKTVSNPDSEPRRAVQNDTLKYVLSEVLRDLRLSGRCYVKYEVHQSCYHITVR